jgi:hypothetical protein
MIPARSSARCLAIVLLFGCSLVPWSSAQRVPTSGKRPVDYANGLAGTAPLDDRKLIGNAPPPGEQLYSGFTSPGAVLPHSSTELACPSPKFHPEAKWTPVLNSARVSAIVFGCRGVAR